MFLRQSTGSQAVKLGPFVDSTDGDTEETALTIANTDILLSKAGGSYAAKNSGGATHDDNGEYTATLDATDTNTVGRLRISVHVAGALHVWRDFYVLEEAIYDALFAASATGDLPAITDDTEDLQSRVPAALVGGRIDATVDGTGMEAGAVSAIAGGLNDPTAGAIADAVWDEAQSGHTTAGTFGEIATEIASILADTNELQTDDVPGLIAALENLSASEVNAEVLDVLNTDTFAEPTGVPAATVTLATKIGFIYLALRNKVTVTSSAKTFHDDAGNAEFAKSLSDDGTTYTEGESSAP